MIQSRNTIAVGILLGDVTTDVRISLDGALEVDAGSDDVKRAFYQWMCVRFSSKDKEQHSRHTAQKVIVRQADQIPTMCPAQTPNWSFRDKY